MKSRNLTLIALVVVALGFSKSTYAAPANNAVVTVLNDVSSINKIEVHGNIELYVSDGPVDQVKVYNQYYSESAFVQSKNGVLNIASYTPEKLIVWVTANDLRSISAYDNAVVKSFGDLSKIEFSVDLHNNATAKLNLDAFSAAVTVNDHAKADLSGSANNFSLTHNNASSVNKYNFTVTHYTESKIKSSPLAKEEDVAGI